MKIVPFELEHFSQMVLRSNDQRAIEGLPNFGEYLRLAAERHLAFTGIVEEGVLGSAGLVFLWPGVAEAWTLTTDLVERYPISFYREIVRYLDSAYEKHGLHRIQCIVQESHTVSQRWVQRMGFRREGLMRAYGANKENYFMYARVN